MLNCPFCAKVFFDRGNLNIHLISHTKEKPYKCPTCSAVFGLSASLKKHIKVVHEGVKIPTCTRDKRWMCPQCSYAGSARSRLEAHMLKHSTELQFPCTVPGCDFKTKYERNLPQHVQRMHSDERPHECTSEGCNYRTNSISNLYRHRKVHSMEKPFVCKFPGCNVTCKYKSSLQGHMSVVHSEEKQLKCPICEFRTKYKSRLRQHQDEHENIKRFNCPAPKCSFATSRNHSLQLHIGSTHTKKDVECTAPGCNFRCGTSVLLKRHVYRKHALQILQCPGNSCNYSTRSPGDLRLHISIQHQNLQSASMFTATLSGLHTGGEAGALDALICPVPECHYQTEFPHRYDRHMKTHDVENRKHVCKFCSFGFKKKLSLQVHMRRRHTGERFYKCSYCHYSAFEGTDIRLHAGKIHSIHLTPRGTRYENVSKWKCHTCSRQFTNYYEFVLHSTTHLKAVVVLERLRLRVV